MVLQAYSANIWTKHPKNFKMEENGQKKVESDNSRFILMFLYFGFFLVYALQKVDENPGKIVQKEIKLQYTFDCSLFKSCSSTLSSANYQDTFRTII